MFWVGQSVVNILGCKSEKWNSSRVSIKLTILNKKVPRTLITSSGLESGSLQLVWHRRHLVDCRNFRAFPGCHSAYVRNSCIFRVPWTARSLMKPHSLPLTRVTSKSTTDVEMAHAEINSFFPVKCFRRQRGKFPDADNRSSVKEGREKRRTNARRLASLSWNQSSAFQRIMITSRACKHARKSINSERSSPVAASVEIVRDRIWEGGWSSRRDEGPSASYGSMMCAIVGLSGSAMMMMIKKWGSESMVYLPPRSGICQLNTRPSSPWSGTLWFLILWVFWPS